MIKITFLVNGKSVNSLEEAFNKATQNGVEQMFRKKLSHMENEVLKNNTQINFSLKDEKITIKGDSAEVNQKIADELTK